MWWSVWLFNGEWWSAKGPDSKCIHLVPGTFQTPSLFTMVNRRSLKNSSTWFSSEPGKVKVVKKSLNSTLVTSLPVKVSSLTTISSQSHWLIKGSQWAGEAMCPWGLHWIYKIGFWFDSGFVRAPVYFITRFFRWAHIFHRICLWSTIQVQCM